MIEVSDTVVIAREPADVFDVAADPERQLEWDAQTLSVVKLTPGALGRGARYRVTVKRLGVIEYEFPEFDRPVRFAHQALVKMGEMYHASSSSRSGKGPGSRRRSEWSLGASAGYCVRLCRRCCGSLCGRSTSS